MMSRERALLKRLAEKDMVQYYYGSLVNEIKELLAQPEQPKQEPVAWMYDWNIPVERNQDVQHAYKSKNHLTTDLTPILNDLNDVENIRPLYLVSQTREPLSNIDIKEASRNAKDISFYNGVKWAERQHGIGGGE